LKQILQQILVLLTPPERRKYALLAGADIFVCIADILFLALLLLIVHVYTQPSGQQVYAFLPDWLFDRHSILPMMIFFLLYSGKNLAGFLLYREQCRFLCTIAGRISMDKLQDYQQGSFGAYINVDSSVNVRKIAHQPAEFCQHVLGGAQQILAQAVLILLTIVAMVIFNARLFFLLFALLLPPVILVFYLVKNILRSTRARAQTSIRKSLQHLQEALSGFVEGNVYGRNTFFLERYMIRQREFNGYLSGLLIAQGIPARMIEIFALLGLVMLVAISTWTGQADSTTVITIGAFMAAAYNIIPGVVKILNLSGQINSYAGTLRDLERTEHPDLALSNRDRQTCIHSIAFEDIGFRYEDHSVLSRINLYMQRGDFLGICGPSGSGKTTILHLLLGFLEPVEGTISVNNVFAGQESRKHCWQSVSYVKQQPFLIHDTIRRNILLEEASSDPCTLEAAIRITGLTDLINSFPEKLDYVIAENGKNISGGQRQRIAIARALCKKADLILLDEPFSELDESSECILLQHFQKLAQEGKLVILITHHKKSLSYCSKILSLNEG